MSEIEYYSLERSEILQYVPYNIKKTLDIGCGTGAFSKKLKCEKNVKETWGIELCHDASKEASKNMDHVFSGDFFDIIDDIPKSYFDCIFFNDVLEHMINPWESLLKVKENLNEDGSVIASIPNIRHITALKGLLLKKDWQYQDFGILDKTHLRFFTKKSMLQMFIDCGYNAQIIGLNKTIKGAWKCDLLNIATLGLLFSDIKCSQYLVIANCKK